MNAIRLVLLLAGASLYVGLAGCVTTGGGSAGGEAEWAQGSGRRAGSGAGVEGDFKAVLNDPGAIGMTVPGLYRLDGKVGAQQYAPVALMDVVTTISRHGILTTFTVNKAQFEVLGKGGASTDPAMTLIVHAAGKADLSQDENVAPFIERLRPLFAAHKEAAGLLVRMEGRVLSLSGTAVAGLDMPRAVLTVCEPGKDLVVDMGGGVKMEFAWIAPGSFIMGSPEDQEGRSYNEGPQHKVTFSKGFWLGKYEVTQEQWEHLMGKNPSEFQGGGKLAPVEHVTWDDCQKFIKRLNAALATTNPPVTFQLPMEAQWEYACRAGSSSRFYSGNSDKDLDKVGWYDGNSGHVTHPVGKKKPNAWGLYDMHGNVWEWCWTMEREYSTEAQLDPAATSGRVWRFIRGGSYGFNAASSSSSERRDAALSIDDRIYTVGFRLVAVQ